MTGGTNVVTLGGGSGQFVLLSALRDIRGLNITAIVSMTDSGGSTGKLRDELGILPPGDVLKCILALSPHREVARGLLLKRFSRSQRLADHTAGNMLLSMLSQYAGSFSEGIDALAEILDVRGTILPVTTDRATLVAVLTNGERIFGEKAIDLPRGDQREKISEVFLVPHHAESIKVHPPALVAIAQADLIILGPGDLFTSLMPNLLVPGIGDAMRDSTAPLAYVTNIMTKFGETEGFFVEDFVSELEQRIGRPLNYLVHNSREPDPELLSRYAKEKAALVRFADARSAADRHNLLQSDLLDDTPHVVRHDADKLQLQIRHVLEETMD